MKASWVMGPPTPFSGHDSSLRYRARKSTGWPVVLLTRWHGPQVNPPMLGSYLHRYCTYCYHVYMKMDVFQQMAVKLCTIQRKSGLKLPSCRHRPTVCCFSKVPMEYNHLQEIPIMALRNRLLLLHHISELFCPCIPMFDLEGRLGQTGHGPSVGFDTLRGILISQGKVRTNKVLRKTQQSCQKLTFILCDCCASFPNLSIILFSC